ncbi:MAG: glycosyl hydrolase [Gemmatimonadaceae bacterium]|nr:glycosyl hydrolase [Gemmatimonadaceae bacterium]NUS33680.1 glycosyl hydrolase [Gemmatimonadaceae bacterium]NUS48298.1 glycosyl hydrolase [Gemmatimonadaceae bacterium]
MGRRLALALLILAGGCATRSRRAESAPVAELWVTTGERSRLLAREPDLPIHMGAASAQAVIDVDETTTYQSIVGFGAALTDASALLLGRLPSAQRDTILRELFGPEPGIGLSFVRVPMGASDFSTRHYSYDDVPAGARDTALAHFSIDADRADRLPLLRRALAINSELRIVASPWSAPAWMKSTGSLIQGTLRRDAFAPFADYFVRFVRAYAAEGIPVFAVTVQNEPAFEPADYPGMRLDAATRAELIGRHLGPRFAQAGIATTILDWDHNWDHPEEPLAVLADSAARRYVSGVAWHCYGGDVSAQETVRAKHPDKDVYFTECSGGDWAPTFSDNLLWSVRTLIIGTVRTGARGVALWNLALDGRGGPHLGGCGNCRGVLTIDSRSGAVTRNEEYYALAHASRFVRSGARRIASSTGVAGLETVAFRNVDASKVLIVANSAATAATFVVRDGTRWIESRVPGTGVATLRWR